MDDTTQYQLANRFPLPLMEYLKAGAALCYVDIGHRPVSSRKHVKHITW